MARTTSIRKEPTENEALELTFLQKELIHQRREMSLEDLWYFATETLFPGTVGIHYEEKLHRPVCEWTGTHDKGSRKLLLMPRGHRKTYLVTIANAVWRIIRDPNIRIILVSALDDTASHFCQMVKRQFQYNEHFLSVFPEFRVSKHKQFGRTYDFTHPMRADDCNLIDPTFRSFYLGAPVAGRRCDVLIADDCIEKKHVTTPEQADKALKDFNDLIPVIDKTGKYNMIFVVGTRWAHNDIYGAMLGEDRGDEAQADLEVAAAFQNVVRHCLEDEHGQPITNPRDEGEPILPLVWSREMLLDELKQYRVDPKRGEEDWWKQYMNVCMSPAGRKFEEEQFDTWMPRLPSGIVYSMFLVDSATKDEQVLMRGDFTVVHVAHFDAHGHLYLTDALRSAKLKGMDLNNELISMHARCKENHGISVSELCKEKVGEDTFFGWVRSEFTRARLPIQTRPLQVRGQGRKYVRIIEALQHPAMARQIHFIETYPKTVHKALVDEAIHLGQWSHDDTIDALSLAFHPDIRIKPRMHVQHDWKLPYHIAPNQLSTKDTNPAALMAKHRGWEGKTDDEPVRWIAPGQTPDKETDGRYGQQGAFGHDVHYDTGESSDMDPTTLDPKRMLLKR